MGRPTKLTPEMQDRVCELLAKGNTREDSATFAGIDPSTFFDWMNKAKEEEEGIFSEFSKAVKRAESEAAVLKVECVHDAINGGDLLERRTVIRKDGTQEVIEKFSAPQWTAAAWWLERRRKKDFSKTETVQLVGEDGGPIKTENKNEAVDLSQLTTEELLLARKIASQGCATIEDAREVDGDQPPSVCPVSL